VLRAAREKQNIQVVAINDPFIPVDYMKYMFYVSLFLCFCVTFIIVDCLNYSMTLYMEDIQAKSVWKMEN
jgi:hypothetical protein